MNREPNEVSNKASALGEAVGVLLEASVNRLLQVVASENNCVYIATGPKNTKTGRATKLLNTESNLTGMTKTRKPPAKNGISM